MIRYQEIAFVAYPVTDMGLFREVGVSNGSLNERLVAADSHPGIASSSPGLRGTSYPGKSCKPRLNPNGVVAALDTLGHNSDGVGSHWRGVPRVARNPGLCRAIPGLWRPRFQISKENAPNGDLANPTHSARPTRSRACEARPAAHPENWFSCDAAPVRR